MLIYPISLFLEDHNITIYYPTSKFAERDFIAQRELVPFAKSRLTNPSSFSLAAAGGGCKKLFRKIGNRSSEFYPDINEVRRDGSYLYEEFVETQGTDVKMYT